MEDFEGRWRRIASRRGFTLVEILLVLLILTVIVGLTAPNLSRSLTKHQFEKSAEELLNLMRYAQSRAITRGHSVRLVFNDENTEYWLAEDSVSGSDSGNEAASSERVPGSMGATRRVPGDVVLRTEDIAVLTFYPDGRMDRTELGVCRGGRCKMISTRIQRGFIRSYDAEEST